jgi:hypothetical protein
MPIFVLLIYPEHKRFACKLYLRNCTTDGKCVHISFADKRYSARFERENFANQEDPFCVVKTNISKMVAFSRVI